MCKKLGQEEEVVEQGSEEQLIEVEPEEDFALGPRSIVGIVSLVLILLGTIIVGGFLIIKFADEEGLPLNASAPKRA